MTYAESSNSLKLSENIGSFLQYSNRTLGVMMQISQVLTCNFLEMPYGSSAAGTVADNVQKAADGKKEQ